MQFNYLVIISSLCPFYWITAAGLKGFIWSFITLELLSEAEASLVLLLALILLLLSLWIVVEKKSEILFPLSDWFHFNYFLVAGDLLLFFCCYGSLIFAFCFDFLLCINLLIKANIKIHWLCIIHHYHIPLLLTISILIYNYNEIAKL